MIDTCFERIAKLEDQIKAWVIVDEAGARQAAAAVYKDGPGNGPISGMLIGIKDIVDVAGWPTRAGAKSRADALPAEQDAEMVRCLRAHGAVIAGKTVTTEFAGFDPPPTCNPWNLEHTPGGSSSGSAAAVAAGMCEAAVGSQTGGSIVRPASFCGVFGYKPAWGVISSQGMVPISSHLDHPGPLARSVESLWWLSHAMRSDAPLPPLPSPADRSLKLGLFDSTLDDPCDPDVAAEVTSAVEKLTQQSVKVDNLPLPFDRAHLKEMHWRLMSVDGAAYHQQAYSKTPELFGQHISQLIEAGLQYSGVEYSNALQAQVRMKLEFSRSLSEFDALLMPSAVTPAPDRSTTGDPQFNAPWSFLGVPSITMPLPTDHPLPIGLQLIGCDESRLFSAALLLEQLLECQWVVRG